MSIFPRERNKMSAFTPKEQAFLQQIRQRIKHLREYLDDHDCPDEEALVEWLDYLSAMRAIQGNFSNDVSFVATVLAKRYLSARFDIGAYDAAAKAQGAQGLDIDLVTADGQHIVGEIKTTVPYSKARDDLGSKQKETFIKDFEKLNAAEADHKFFFVTDRKTYEVVQQRYLHLIPGVEVVLLTEEL
jgi:hypothetical protein